MYEKGTSTISPFVPPLQDDASQALQVKFCKGTQEKDPTHLLSSTERDSRISETDSSPTAEYRYTSDNRKEKFSVEKNEATETANQANGPILKEPPSIASEWKVVGNTARGQSSQANSYIVMPGADFFNKRGAPEQTSSTPKDQKLSTEESRGAGNLSGHDETQRKNQRRQDSGGRTQDAEPGRQGKRRGRRKPRKQNGDSLQEEKK